MVLGEDALAVRGGDDGSMEPLGHRSKFRGRPVGAATGQDHRPPRARQAIGCRPQCGRPGNRGRGDGRRGNAHRTALLQHIEGDLQMDRAGPPSGHQRERLRDDHGDLRDTGRPQAGRGDRGQGGPLVLGLVQQAVPGRRMTQRHTG